MELGLSMGKLIGIGEAAIDYADAKIDPALRRAVAMAVAAAVDQNNQELTKQLSAKD